MYLFDDIFLPIPEPILAPSTSSKRLFIEGAVKALQSSSVEQQNIILQDLAEYLACEPSALIFMVGLNAYDEAVYDVQLTMPHFRGFQDI